MKNDQLTCIRLDLTQGSVDLFDHFAAFPRAILLDSASADHPNSRYHLIAINPLHWLEAKGGECFLDGEKSPVSPFTLIKQKLTQLSSAKAPFELPFNGGWLGYFGYDLGRYIESIPTLAESDIALPDMAIGLYPDALIFDKRENAWFYIAQPGCDRLDSYLAAIDSTPSHAPFALAGEWQSNMTRDEYGEKFARVQEYLLCGDCYQINLAQRFSARFSGSPWRAYQTLREANQAPFSAFISLGDEAVVSISPERFIEVKGDRVETKPIKGTLPRLADPEQDRRQAERLAQSPKDRAENVMIVDLLRNDLGKVAKPGSVDVPSLFAVESFPAVHHLVSTVTATLAEGKSAVDQLEAAFPGGSITGAPKIRAMEIIEELEPHRRSVYCGSIGYLSGCGNMDTSITIRTLVCEKNRIHCWAGGGVVADSKVDMEYQETYDKVNKILPLLQ